MIGLENVSVPYRIIAASLHCEHTVRFSVWIMYFHNRTFNVSASIIKRLDVEADLFLGSGKIDGCQASRNPAL